MLKDVAQVSARRFREVRSYLSMIRKLTSKKSPLVLSAESVIAKGLFFVHLYGAYEFTIAYAVQKTIQLINTSGFQIADCEPRVLSLVLSAECDSLGDVGRTKKWDRRHVLFGRINSTELIHIDDTLFPTDGRNIKYEQLQTIWRAFHVSAPVLPRLALKGKLEELVDNRNAIAHGRESPAAIGGRYTPQDLSKSLRDVDEVCSYVIQTLEEYLTNEDYLS